MGNYDLFKQALLLKFELIPKVYRNRFWGVRKTPSVTYKEVTNLLWEYLRKWGKGTGATTSEDMCNLVGLKQLYDICSPDLKMWLVDPKHWALADEFVDSRSGGGGREGDRHRGLRRVGHPETSQSCDSKKPNSGVPMSQSGPTPPLVGLEGPEM